MDIGQIAAGLASNPLAWGLTLAIAAIVYLYRENSAAKKELIDAYKEPLMKTTIVCEKMTDCVEILERVTDALMKRSE